MQDDQNLLEQQQQQKTVKSKTPYIYAWGRNQDGQLAISSAKNTFLPTPPKGLKGYARQIATARTHTAILNNQGEIYMTGSLLFGKLGITAQVNNFRQFHLQQQMSQYHVKQVACGDYHTLALTSDGMVFSWGGSLWDKTGHKGGGVHQINKLSNQKITQIACGDFHSVAINDKGQVYSWGGGGANKNKGQLGHSNKKDLPHPELIQFFKGKYVTKIACGDYHTMVMTDDNQIHAFGQGNFGQLGTGGKEDSATPKKVLLNFSLALQQYFRSDINQKTKVQQMALGGHHSLLLTNKGHVYVCGYGSQGQLGLGQGHTNNKYEPTLVKSLLGKQVINVTAGANHSLALTSKHDVYSCGYNAKGQLGIGQQRSITLWTHVEKLAGKNIGHIFCGGDHSWAIVNQTNPSINNYEFPSPLKFNIQEPTLIRLNQGSIIKPQKSVLSGNSMNEILVELTSNRKLQLILTQVELSHRFIHFIIKDSCRNPKKKIQEYINFVYQNQRKQMKYHKVIEDTQIIDAKGKVVLPNNPKGTTIMLVCEIASHANEYLYADCTKNTIAIGDLLMMESGMLKIEGKVPQHNKWFFKFNEMFEDDLQIVRFIELRPKHVV